MGMLNRLGRTLLLTAVLLIAARTASAQQQQNFTGNGGKGISLTIYVPQSTGLAKEQSYIPALVQGEFVSNFSNYSAISILDWERLDDIYVKLTAEEYDDKAEAKQDVVLGRLAPTSHFLTGNITKTATGYNIKMNITATADKMTVATYSGTLTFAELDNLTGVRRASIELLQKVGVELTEKARQELAGAADANQISAQKALARGVTAQRAGTEVAALSYYFQAASFNPALKEAVNRSTIVAANISSGNIGADLRNDIIWRKNWVARLKETEEAVSGMIAMIMSNAVNPPYKLIYFTDIKTGNVNYQTETADLSITMAMNTNGAWFTAMRQTLDAAGQATQTVLNGLDATKRKDDWKLARWPRESASEKQTPDVTTQTTKALPYTKMKETTGWSREDVSNVNPFASYIKKQYDITVVFELVNQQGRVIGSQTVKLNPSFDIYPKFNNIRYIPGRDDRFEQFTVTIIGDNISTVTFKGVKADNISDNLTIRVASVNGVSPQQARFAITAMSSVVENSLPFIDSRNSKQYNTVRIGGRTWMAENLNYQPQTGNSWCYNDDNSNCNKYGRLYDWNTAMSICPTGWYLSTNADWEKLIGLIGGKDTGKKLKAKNGWNNGNGTDSFGFSALPGGYRYFGARVDRSTFHYAGSYGKWWTAEASNWVMGDGDSVSKCSGDCGEPMHIGYSVRCVQD